MKYSLLIFCFLLLYLPKTTAQEPAAHFYRQHKRMEGVQNFKIPGWLIWLVSGIAYDLVKDEENVKPFLRLVRKVQKMRLMIVEDKNPIPTEAVQNFVSESRRTGYADLIFVRDGETTVQVLGEIRRNNKFKNLIILINEDDEFIFMHLKSNIRMKDLSEVINHSLQKSPLKRQRPEPKRPKKERKSSLRKIPRA